MIDKCATWHFLTKNIVELNYQTNESIKLSFLLKKNNSNKLFGKENYRTEKIKISGSHLKLNKNLLKVNIITL